MSSRPAPQVTVASVPATHIYVRRLAHPRVRRLRDPSGDDHRTPCFLDPVWWDRTTDRPDLLHVHFGFEYYDPGQLAELAEVLERHRVPLVFTVHDLRNPNHPTPDLHEAALDVLVPAATSLVTLTPWAAAGIEQRWGRPVVVLPHPHVADLDDIAAVEHLARPATSTSYRLGLHFKSLRPNMAGAPVLDAVAGVARRRDVLRLEVHLHCDVISPRGHHHDPALVTRACDLADEGLVDLRVHPYLSHDDLEDLILRCDGYLLPYTFGTHSGLLELCRDLGTAVIAPDCGGYADQGAHHVFRADETHGIDATDLHRVVDEAVAAGPPAPMSAATRKAQRREIADAHHRLYMTALTRPRRISRWSRVRRT